MDLYSLTLTEDGSITYFNEKFRQCYHSKHGAYREALEKHVEACQISELATKQESIKILDICFGLGYNSFVAIDEAKKINSNINISITALENDPEIIEKIFQIEFPDNLTNIVKNFEIEYRRGFGMINVIVGDAREKILESENDFFDAVFFDPFSPASCPELWSEEFIKNVVSKAKPGAYISTYSCARIVKDNFAKAGCEIGEGPKAGRRNGGVLARKI